MARHSTWHQLEDWRFGPDARVHVVDGARIRSLTPAFGSSGGTAFRVASSDGGEVYEFSSDGRHRRTRDALTGTDFYVFAYDANGSVIGVTDADGTRRQLSAAREACRRRSSGRSASEPR